MAYKIAWIIPILLVPLIGGVMYIILGGSRKPHYRRAETRRAMKHYLVPQLSTTDFLHYGADAMQQAWYLEHAALCPAYRNTETTYYPTGADFFPVFLRELAQAKEYIFLEYFIIAEGSMWSDVLDILTEKAAAGVEVRVIYDGVGSAPTLPSDYPQQLAQKGIRCQEFQPFRPLLSIHQNNRDHRKICVIDGGRRLRRRPEPGRRIREPEGAASATGRTMPSASGGRRCGAWRSSSCTMWNSPEPRHADFCPFRPRPCPGEHHRRHRGSPTPTAPWTPPTPWGPSRPFADDQPRPSGTSTSPRPTWSSDDEHAPPPCAPPPESGVDVRILTPHIPDKKVVFEVTQSNYTRAAGGGGADL